MEKLPSKEKILTIPNVLSIVRIVLIIPFVLFVMRDNYLGAGFVLVFSGITDLLDGFIARKLGQVSRLGKILDPAADKITLISIIICVGVKFPETLPFMIILILKEAAMIVGGAFLLKRKKVPVEAKWYGKLATVMFYVSIITIIGLKAVWNISNVTLNITLMSVTAVLMLFAVARYLKLFLLIIKNEVSK